MTKKPLLASLTVAAAVAACGAPPPGEGAQQSSEPIGANLVYNFGTLAHPGACLDARAAGTADGTQLQEFWCNGTAAQAFTVQDAGNGAFSLVNAHANKCVDVQARGTANGTKIQLFDCNQTPAQTFFIEPKANGFVTLVNTNSGKCLDVQADNPADGTVVQLFDCNGTNAQLWNPAVIGAPVGGGTSTPAPPPPAPPPPAPPPPSGGGSGGLSNAVLVHVTNGCPVNVWIHGQGVEGVLQPDNAELTPGQSRDYAAPLNWTAARVNAFLQAPDAQGNPQGQSDKVEMDFSNAGGTETLNTDITYVDFVALPSEIQSFGSGSDCTKVGCEVPFSQVLDGCPSQLLQGHECLSAGSYCLDPTHNGDPLCHELDGQISACAAQQPGCAGAAGSSTADVYACAGGFFSQSPQFCAALNRGVLSSPGPNTPASAFYQNPPFNPYAAWVHQRCPGIYAFPYDDFGSSNQSSDHTCTGATRMDITFCPKG